MLSNTVSVAHALNKTSLANRLVIQTFNRSPEAVVAHNTRISGCSSHHTLTRHQSPATTMPPVHLQKKLIITGI
jgi:hypothetical protein